MSSGTEARGELSGQAWRRRFSALFSAWLSRRIPPGREVTLNQRRIFIMPSRVGAFFFACLLVMLLAAVNYQNNMSYALTFLLASLFIVAILHTYANLSGLTLRALKAGTAWPGELAAFKLCLEHGGKRPRYALRLSWPGGEEQVLNLPAAAHKEFVLHCRVEQRGWHHPGRLLIESTYPLGLLRCWSWVDLDLKALVYPAPLPGPLPSSTCDGRQEGGAAMVSGNDDFFGLRDYRAGDALSQVHWKAYAAGRSLQSKVYGSHAARDLWLDWDSVAGQPTEQRLSLLCYSALELTSREETFGLRLPGLELPPSTGAAHLEAVLRALALYGLAEAA